MFSVLMNMKSFLQFERWQNYRLTHDTQSMNPNRMHHYNLNFLLQGIICTIQVSSSFTILNRKNNFMNFMNKCNMSFNLR